MVKCGYKVNEYGFNFRNKETHLKASILGDLDTKNNKYL